MTIAFLISDKSGLTTFFPQVNAAAQKCAEYMAAIGEKKHVCKVKFNHPYGENLYWGNGYNLGDSKAAIQATDTWYSEEKNHDYSKQFQHGTGHFTQVIGWQSMIYLSQIVCGVLIHFINYNSSFGREVHDLVWDM